MSDLYDAYKYAMNKVDCNFITLWKNYKSRYVTNNNYDKFQEFIVSNEFRMPLQSLSQNKNRETHVLKKLGFELGTNITNNLLDHKSNPK